MTCSLWYCTVVCQYLLQKALYLIVKLFVSVEVQYQIQYNYIKKSILVNYNTGLGFLGCISDEISDL